MKKNNMDLLNGSLWNKILMFALPLAASNILQQFFNAADMAVVGQFSGKAALAAVGSNGSIINLLINLFVGLSIGTNVIIARQLGEGKTKKASITAHTAILLSLVCGVFVMIVGLIIARPILEFMGSPDDVIDLATVYLKIYFLGMPFIMLYNFGSAILRSIGDTKRPFICLSVSGIINIILNLLFVVGFGMSVEGVGIATVVSNMISALMVLYFLMHDESEVKIERKNLHFNLSSVEEMSVVGIPAGIQNVVFSISNLSVQSSLNSLGSSVMAGSVAALNFEMFVYFLFSAYAQACLTFTSQNLGAGKTERCKKSIKLCILQAFFTSLVLVSVFIIFREQLVRFYTNEINVIPYAITRMVILLPFMFINMINEVLSGALRGMKYSLTPALISVFGICGIRFVYVFTVFPKNPTFETLLAVYPLSWMITTAGIIVAYAIYAKKVFNTEELIKREEEL